MPSPNHNTAADAIGAAAQKSQNRRQDNSRNEAIEAIHQAAMPGNDVT
jgi:hypothetical protein